MPELFRCEHFSKRFGGHQALSGVGFSVHEGEILGIIGPNGSGKTTLMECLTGLLPFDDGCVYWNGRQISPTHIRQFIFYLPDGIRPYADQRVGVVLRCFQQLYGAKKEHLDQLTMQLELSPMLGKQVCSLSKGYHRRLLLLIGLLSPQPLLMLDEPFDGFDLRQSLGVMDLLRESLEGRTLLLSVHQLTEAEKICDRFLLLNSGKVAAIGSLAQLRKQVGMSSGNLEEIFLAIV